MLLSAATLGTDEQDVMLSALRTGDLSAACFELPDRALLAYADKLTMTPAAISDDVQSLRNAGFDNRAIHEACAIIAHFAFVNRIADGLGVELEDRLR